MRTSTIVDYENTSHIEGDDLISVSEACGSSMSALLKLKHNKLLKIEGIDVTFIARTSRVVQKIGLSDEFWLSVALERYED